MKKSKVFSDGKIVGALMAVSSGIITELIYDIVSTSHFEILPSDETNLFYIVEISDYSILQRIAIVLIVFGVAWTLMAIAIPKVIAAIKIRRIHTRKVLTAKQVSYEYYNIKTNVLELFNEFVKNDFVLYGNIEKKDQPIDKYKFAYKEEITLYINRLYNVFKYSGIKGKKIIDSAFRDDGDVGLACRYISKKDYYNLIDILEHLLVSVEEKDITNAEISDSEYINDYTKLLGELKYLKNI